MRSRLCVIGLLSSTLTVPASAETPDGSSTPWLDDHLVFFASYGVARVSPPVGPSSIGYGVLLDVSLYVQSWFAAGLHVRVAEGRTLEEYDPATAAGGVSIHFFVGRLGLGTGLAIASLNPRVIEYAGKAYPVQDCLFGFEIPADASLDVYRFSPRTAIVLFAELAVQFFERERAVGVMVGPMIRARWQ